MIDFQKLNDPTYQAEVRREAAEAAAQEKVRAARLSSALALCLDGDGCTDGEYAFLQSVKLSLSAGRTISAKQEKWLLDIEARVMPKTYVSVSHGLRGYFAVLIETDSDGCAMPTESGISSFKKREGAVNEGIEWAKTEGLRFIG